MALRYKPRRKKLVDTTISVDIEVTKDLEILCNMYELTPEELLYKFGLSAVYEAFPNIGYKPTIKFMVDYQVHAEFETKELSDEIFKEKDL